MHLKSLSRYVSELMPLSLQLSVSEKTKAVFSAAFSLPIFWQFFKFSFTGFILCSQRLFGYNSITVSSRVHGKFYGTSKLLCVNDKRIRRYNNYVGIYIICSYFPTRISNAGCRISWFWFSQYMAI